MFDIIKLCRILDLKWLIIEKEGNLPELAGAFYRIGIVLFHRDLSTKGSDNWDYQDCDNVCANLSDKFLLDNFNNLYSTLILKYGNLGS